ncbi:hypothetical protein ABTW96_28970 [Nocardia beijingensis]|uniref:hypothetical protein n=1 Tax=Nocardia beijingensis TaxID=95162 RepID=UPI003329A899
MGTDSDARLRTGPARRRQVAADGISIGTATSYDRTGPLGTCVVTALSNARRQVDLAATSRT